MSIENNLDRIVAALESIAAGLTPLNEIVANEPVAPVANEPVAPPVVPVAPVPVVPVPVAPVPVAPVPVPVAPVAPVPVAPVVESRLVTQEELMTLNAEIMVEYRRIATAMFPGIPNLQPEDTAEVKSKLEEVFQKYGASRLTDLKFEHVGAVLAEIKALYV